VKNERSTSYMAQYRELKITYEREKEKLKVGKES
jgi:hypothetical protein